MRTHKDLFSSKEKKNIGLIILLHHLCYFGFRTYFSLYIRTVTALSRNKGLTATNGKHKRKSLHLKHSLLLERNFVAYPDACEIHARNRPRKWYFSDRSTQLKSKVQSNGSCYRKFLARNRREISRTIPIQQRTRLKTITR